MSVINVRIRTYSEYGLRVLHTGGQSNPGIIPSIMIVPIQLDIPVELLVQLVQKANQCTVPDIRLNVDPLLRWGVPKSPQWDEYSLVVDDSMHDGFLNQLVLKVKMNDEFRYRPKLLDQLLNRRIYLPKES